MAPPGEDADFVSGFTDVYAPAVGAAIVSSGAATALSVAFTAVAPLAIVAGIFKAISGRRKRKRRRRAARRKLRAQRKTARGHARHVGVQSQQSLGQVTASATQFGGTMAAGMSQAVMGSVFLQQQRIMQGVGLTMKKMTKSSDKALRKERNRRRWEENQKKQKDYHAKGNIQ